MLGHLHLHCLVSGEGFTNPDTHCSTIWCMYVFNDILSISCLSSCFYNQATTKVIVQRWKIDIWQVRCNSYISKNIPRVHSLPLSALSICALSHQSLTSHRCERAESSFNATNKPSISAQHRKVLCNIWAFRWWCADVSSFRGKRTESGHTHTLSTHTLFALPHAQTMFSVGLQQTADFCQQCRLNLVVFSFWDEGQDMVAWWWYRLFLTEYVFMSVLKMWRKWVDGARERRRGGSRDGAVCTRRKLGLMLLHAAAPKHPHSSCWSACMCFCFLCIDLVSYFHIRKEEPLLFQSEKKSIYSRLFM